MLKNIIVIVGLMFLPICYEANCKDIVVQIHDGTLTLGDFLAACEEAGQCTSSKRVPADLPGKIITINNTPYEIRFFSFEDTSGKLAPSTTFLDYIKQNQLLGLKSIVTSPLPNIQFESFDFRKNPKKDGGYFSLALRPIENGDS